MPFHFPEIPNSLEVAIFFILFALVALLIAGLFVYTQQKHIKYTGCKPILIVGRRCGYTQTCTCYAKQMIQHSCDCRHSMCRKYCS